MVGPARAWGGLLAVLVACGPRLVPDGAGDAGTGTGTASGADASTSSGGSTSGSSTSTGQQPKFDVPPLDVPPLMCPARPTCTPYTQFDGTVGNLISCDTGSLLKTGPAACGEVPPLLSCTDPLGCSSDAECTDGPTGQCGHASEGLGCQCHYPCQQDSDCGPDGACICSAFDGPFGDWTHHNYCSFGNCSGPDDCGGYDCALDGPWAYCHGPRDECQADCDCWPDGLFNCVHDSFEDRWRCTTLPPPN